MSLMSLSASSSNEDLLTAAREAPPRPRTFRRKKKRAQSGPKPVHVGCFIPVCTVYEDAPKKKAPASSKPKLKEALGIDVEEPDASGGDEHGGDAKEGSGEDAASDDDRQMAILPVQSDDDGDGRDASPGLVLSA